MPCLDDEKAAAVAAIPANLCWAMFWSKRGWPVFPLMPGTKRPFPGTHGHLDATRDPAKIREFWKQWPDALIGGRTDHRVVIDLDAYKEQHAAELASLRADGFELPPTRTHRRGKGRHLIYRNGIDLPADQIRAKLASSIDVKRSARGYIVLPPSIHPSGDRYSVCDWRAEAALPDGLVAFLRKPDGPPALADAPDAQALPPTLPDGVRRALRADQLDDSGHTFRVACAGARAGWSPGQVRTLLEQDEVTQNRWNDRPHLVYLELTEMLAKAFDKARPTVPRTPRPGALERLEKVYNKWLPNIDPVPTRAVLAAYVANTALEGDAVWLMLVGGSSSGKTERLLPITSMPGVVMASSVTGEAAFLSASPSKEKAKNATGGLLRQVGDRGILVLKDFTSVLSMHRDKRAEVLAALREIYDGRWDRHYGTDGGQVLTWEGKCGLIAGCTTAIDTAHAVMAEMGPRMLFVRLPVDEEGTLSLGRTAFEEAGAESQMRGELAEAARELLGSLPGDKHPVTTSVRDSAVALASLVCRARSPVDRDFKHEMMLVGDPEEPGRVVKLMRKLWESCGLVGLTEDESWQVVRRAALDSVPKLRGRVLAVLARATDPLPTSSASGFGVANLVDHPRSATTYALEDLVAHRVVNRYEPEDKGEAVMWELSETARHQYRDTVQIVSRGVPYPSSIEGRD